MDLEATGSESHLFDVQVEHACFQVDSATEDNNVAQEDSHAHAAHSDLEASTNQVGDTEQCIWGIFDDGDMGEDIIEVDIVGALYHLSVAESNLLWLIPRPKIEAKVLRSLWVRD